MKEFKIEGFVSNPTATDALAVAVFGEQGSGKTRLMCTAPGPIGIIPLDRKTRRTVERIGKELDKQIFLPADDFIRVDNPMKLAILQPMCADPNKIIPLDAKAPLYCCARHYYRWHVNRVKTAAFKLYAHPEIKSIGIDTGSQLWEDILYAHYGRCDRIMPRDRGPANQEMIDFLNCLSGKNLVITHKAREIWKNDKPTGKFDLAGFSHTGYYTNVIVECVCDPAKSAGDERFYANVHMCQDNPDIQGPNGKKLLTDDAISFQMLAYSIYPESDQEQWS